MALKETDLIHKQMTILRENGFSEEERREVIKKLSDPMRGLLKYSEMNDVRTVPEDESQSNKPER